MKELHRKLIRKGYFAAARLLLKLLRKETIYIADGYDEVYESGLVEFLQTNVRWWNGRQGFYAAI